MRRSASILTFLLALATPATAQMLPDSTYVEGWTLSNGLEVRLRHVPGAVGVAVAASFRAGRAMDAVGSEGQAELMANLFYTAPTAEHPARTLEDMPRLRPLGWGIQINPRLVVLTEIGTHEQLPGILHELGSRMRGLTIDDARVKATAAALRRQLGERYLQRPELTLHYRLRELGEGVTDAQMLARASGASFDKLTSRDLKSQINRLYAPANAALVLVGDLADFELQRMIESEFGPLPAGIALAEPTDRPMVAASRVTTHPSVTRSTGGLAVFAPALEDSLHPSFFLGMLMMGAWCNDHWGKPDAPLTSRFHYSLYDEPDLVRFYPPLAPGTTSAQSLADEFNVRAEIFSGTSTPMSSLDQFRASLGWILGGPLSPSIRRRAAVEGGPLGTIATTTAMRTLWRGDAFWGQYARRFFTTGIVPSTFHSMICAPENQVVLVLNPTGSGR